MQKIRPDMDIGKNIQAIRYQNKLTQDQVIAKIKPDGYLHVQKYLCQARNQPYEHQVSELVALAKIFHTDINTFFSGLL